MCTLVWQLVDGALQIIANRDEQRSRVRAEAPQVYKEQGTQFIMPRDPEGDGSWIAVNEHGLTIALLNYYDAISHSSQKGSPQNNSPHKESPAQSFNSRGLLVRGLARLTEMTAIDAELAALQLQQFRPFYLLVFSGVNEPVCWTWNGETLTQSLMSQPAVTTSAWANRSVSRYRMGYITRLLKKTKTAEQTLQLLLEKMQKVVSWGGGFALRMRRKDACTVSTTTVRVTTKAVTLHYYDYCEAESPVPLKVELPLQRPSENSLIYQQSSRFDLEALLHRYQPKLAARLPALAWISLRWLLVEGKVNRTLASLENTHPQHFSDHALRMLGVNVSVNGAPFPAAKERPVFVCNHPTGGLDGLITIAILQKRYPGLRVVANTVLGTVDQLGSILVPVDVFANPKQALKPMTQAFSGNEPLLIFPAGRTARMNEDGELDDGDWSAVALKLAAKSGRVITPLHLNGRNSPRFYWLAQCRKRLNITLNLEMFLLARELINPHQKCFQLYVGRAQQASVVSQRMSTFEAAQHLKALSYQLAHERQFQQKVST